MLIIILFLTVVLVIGLFYILSPVYNPSKINLKNSHVIVTGGSRGIGKSLAKLLLKRGANVTIFARNQQRLNDCEKELQRYSIEGGGQLLCLSVDVSSSYDVVEQNIKTACVRQGPVTVLINNAGVFFARKFQDTTPQDFEEMMKTNYLGCVYCTKASIDYMLKQGYGRIAFVSSLAGQVGLFGYTSYCSTKFALKGLAEALQMEFAKYNIYITIAYPPDTETPGTMEELSNNKLRPPETRALEQTAGFYKSDEVAEKIIKSMTNGSFSCSFGVIGYISTCVTSGVGPITRLSDALLQTLFISIAKLFGMIVLKYFYTVVRKRHHKTN